LPSKNLKVKNSGSLIFPVVLCGYETWSLTLTEKDRGNVFEDGVLRKMHGTKVENLTRIEGNSTARNLIVCSPHQILLR
jgi:hypothetical protein